MGKKRTNFKFRIGADERCFTVEKQVKSKTAKEGYTWVAIRWFATAKQLAHYLMEMEAKYLVNKGEDIVVALEQGKKMVEHLLSAEETEFDLRKWENSD